MNRLIKQIIIYILVALTLFNCMVPHQVVYASELAGDNTVNFDGYHAFSLDASKVPAYYNSDGNDVMILFNKPIYTAEYYDYIGEVTNILPMSSEVYSTDEAKRYLTSEEYKDYASATPYGLIEFEPSGKVDWEYAFVKEEDWEELSFIIITGDTRKGENVEISPVYKLSDQDWLIKEEMTGQEAKDKEDSKTKNQEGVSIFERLITIFLVTLGDGAMWAIGAVAGGSITLDSLIFGTYPNTNLAIFKDSQYVKANPFLSSSNVLSFVESIYNVFSGIAIAVFLASLLYVGVRILIDGTGKKRAKYQEYLMAWIQGVVILFVFPFIMRLMIDVNYALVEDIKEIGSSVISGGGSDMPSIQQLPFSSGIETSIHFGGQRRAKPTSYMEQLRDDAWNTGKAVYALCWLILIGEIVKFFFIYFKRLLITLFLIAIFPLVTLTYAIDKIGDGKSQAFSNWFKEFTLNVFLQAFHAINYTVVMAIISASRSLIGTSDLAMGRANYILILIAITYVANGDNILRGIFGQTGGVGTVKSAAETVLKTSAAVDIARRATKGIKNTRKRIGGYVDTARGISDRNLRIRESRINERFDSFRATHPGTPTLSALEHPLDDDFRDTIRADAEALKDPSISGSAARDVLGRMGEYMKDPTAKHELYEALKENGISTKEVNDLITQNNAALDLEVMNNLDILINRKNGTRRSSMYRRMTDELLAANGLTDEMLNDKKKALSTVDKLERGTRSAHQKVTNRGGRRASRGRARAGQMGAGGQVLDGAGEAGIGTPGGMHAGSASGNRARRNSLQGNVGKINRKKYAGKNLKAATMSSLNNDKSTTKGPAASSDPIKMNYYDTRNDVKGNKRSNQQKRTKQQIKAVRREQAIEKQKAKLEKVATTIDHAETRRVHYSNAAYRMAEASDSNATRVEQISALMEAKRELDKAWNESSTQQERETVYEVSRKMNDEVKLDEKTKASVARINRAVEQAMMNAEYLGMKLTPGAEATAYETAIATEALRTGEGTFQELWDAYHTCIKNGVTEIDKDSIRVHGLALSVATLNAHDVITGDESKGIINEAIRDVREHAHDGGIYKSIIDELKYDPSQLREGERPSQLRENDSNPIHIEDMTANSIKKRIEQRAEERSREAQEYRDSIYNVDKKSYDVEKDKHERNREIIRLSKNLGKEVLRDAAAITGATTAFAAYEAVDQKHNATEIMSAITVGGAAGAKVVDTADYYVEEAIDIAKDIRDELNEGRDGRNPIKLHGKKK